MICAFRRERSVIAVNIITLKKQYCLERLLLAGIRICTKCRIFFAQFPLRRVCLFTSSKLLTLYVRTLRVNCHARNGPCSACCFMFTYSYSTMGIHCLSARVSIEKLRILRSFRSISLSMSSLICFLFFVFSIVVFCSHAAISL